LTVWRCPLAGLRVLRARPLTASDAFASVFAVLGETEDERAKAEASLRVQIAFYCSTPNYRRLFEHHGSAEEARHLSQHMRNGEFHQMPRLVLDHLMDALSVHRDLGDLPAKLGGQAERVLDRVWLYFPSAWTIPTTNGRRLRWRVRGEAERRSRPLVAVICLIGDRRAGQRQDFAHHLPR